MNNEESIIVEADLDGEVLFASDASMGKLLIALAAGTARHYREGAAVGTAHDELLYAVA